MLKKKIVFPILATLLCSSCNISSTSEEIDYEKLYGKNYKVENTTADKQYLYGMCDLGWSEHSWNNPPISHDMQAELYKNLGCKSVRVWLHCNWLMDDPNTYNEEGLALARNIVEKLTSYDFQIIGMNHSNFHPSGYENSSDTVCKPARDLEPGSEYMKWLEDYKTTWYNLVSAFPEIKYWEIDNEPNNDVFFTKLSGGTFSLKEKAAIYTDMMYYASLGIHEANPDAVTVMGGLVTWNAETFLQYLYDNIYSLSSWSNYPDDYFQVACWHPYTSDFEYNKYKKLNDDIYNVIKTNEKKDKKVFLTEFGFSEVNVPLQKQLEWLPQVYDVFEKAEYIEAVHYFRPFDDLGSTWGASTEKYFGLFTDPLSHGIDGSNKVLAAPKETAYKFQELAGGTGSLTVYQDFILASKE